MPEHNEAMRLAEWLRQNSSGVYRPAAEAAALIRQQAERIAELEARVHTCGPTCSKAGCINRRITAERDQLRAEVERLKNNRDMWKGQCEQQAERLTQIHAEQSSQKAARTTHKETE